jgi:hypothetical protein
MSRGYQEPRTLIAPKSPGPIGCEPQGSGVAARQRDEAWRVVAVEQVQLQRRNLRRVRGHDARQLPPKLGPIDRMDVAGVFVRRRHERFVQWPAPTNDRIASASG